MAKTAVLKKSDLNKMNKSKSKTSVKATAVPKKPMLKVVKPAKPVAKAKPAAKSAVKPVKATPKAQPKVAATPVAKVAAKPAKAAAPVKMKAFSVGSYVVYPTHGVGRIVAEETQVIGDTSIKMLVISFEKDRMTLRVPLSRAATAGLRHISGGEQMQKVFVTLKNRARVSRGMWSRRAQEYETKINSGNVMLIAEVVRDLHPNVDQAERSYSERMIYESALNRLVGELAASDGIDLKVATDRVLTLLRSKMAVAA